MALSDNTIRGVNLGGWLVLERYIKPSLFTVPECFDKGLHDPDVCTNEVDDAYPQVSAVKEMHVLG